jgi:hypothetical protein
MKNTEKEKAVSLLWAQRIISSGLFVDLYSLVPAVSTVLVQKPIKRNTERKDTDYLRVSHGYRKTPNMWHSVSLLHSRNTCNFRT